MKVIISHDVDHITSKEHINDLVIPKFILRAFMEKISGSITWHELSLRINETFVTGKWQNIEELLFFDKQHGVPSTFFVGVAKGLGLSYSQKDAQKWIKKILSSGFDVGLHGIGYDDPVVMEKEKNDFARLSGLQNFGVRMHYLRNNESTFQILNDLDYLFDSTAFQFRSPYLIGDMVEFPLHIMEGRLMYSKSRYSTLTLDEVKALTMDKLNYGLKNNLKYFSILFHDRFFSDAFCIWKNWYMWLIEYIGLLGIPFCSYRQVIDEYKI